MSLKQILLTAALLASAGSLANADIFTFTGNSSEFWDVPGNWNPNGVPGTDDTAIIPQDKTCNVRQAEVIRDLIVNSNGVDPGIVNIQAGASLTLGHGSDDEAQVVAIVAGEINLQSAPGDPARLLIARNLLVNGDGTIIGRTPFNPGEIDSTESYYRFTLDGTVVLGGTVTINAKFTNSSLVHAGADIVSGNEIITLAATSEPRGDGEWRLTDLRSRIRFLAEVPSTVMIGQFTLTGSMDNDPVVLEITEDVTTHGHLILVKGNIVVSAGKLFVAGFPIPF